MECASLPPAIARAGPAAAARRVKQAALDAGFDLAGIAAARAPDPAPLDRFLTEGWVAELGWMRESRAKRLDPLLLLPAVRSVVAVAVSYAADDPPRPSAPHGTVARYARGRDYHNVLNRPLRRLRAWMERELPGGTGYTSCDFRPVLEKYWARRAGLGWTGRNGCFIAPPHGSWVVLGTILTGADLEPDEPHPERCGTCTACLPACPTNAIPEPGFVDCRRCLAYHTVEHRGPIPADVAAGLGGRLFGCDACQEPCPWNRGARPGGALSRGLAPRPERSFVPLEELLRADDDELDRFCAGSALARAGAAGLRRTARLLAAQAGGGTP